MANTAGIILVLLRITSLMINPQSSDRIKNNFYPAWTLKQRLLTRLSERTAMCDQA